MYSHLHNHRLYYLLQHKPKSVLLNIHAPENLGDPGIYFTILRDVAYFAILSTKISDQLREGVIKIMIFFTLGYLTPPTSHPLIGPNVPHCGKIRDIHNLSKRWSQIV